jgi:hypothetical protein
MPAYVEMITEMQVKIIYDPAVIGDPPEICTTSSAGVLMLSAPANLNPINSPVNSSDVTSHMGSGAINSPANTQQVNAPVEEDCGQ